MNAKAEPSPDLIFDTLIAYQKTAALKAAIDMDLFKALAAGPSTAAQLATSCGAAPRGVRILCDYMTVHGLLHKSGEKYNLTPDSAAFLNRKSPAYLGGATEFLLSDHLTSAFRHLTDAVRKGGTAEPQQGSVTPDHPMWVTFARAMGGLMIRGAEGLADLLPLDAKPQAKVLDIAAGHGIWGITLARKYPQVQLVALDWSAVLKVALENARAAGIANRFRTIEGSAFDSDLGADYDAVLIPNFLHHFNMADCIRFLKKAHAALAPSGKVAIVEFVPNPDRITPPQAAGFSLVMLATTPEGDAYTFDQYASMLAQAGFHAPTAHPLPGSVNQALIARK